MEPDNSLPHSQVPPTCPYPEHVNVPHKNCVDNRLPDDEPMRLERCRRRPKIAKGN